MAYKDIDTYALRQAVNIFINGSYPSNADGSAHCTNQDLKNVIDNVAALFNTFIDELEN